MAKGWIKLYRKFLDWEWYGDHKVVALFVHCLLKANHKKKQWRGNTIPRGTFITSYDSLSSEIGLSTRELRTAFKKLESTGEIDKRSTSVNSWVTVVNYDSYQSSDKPETKERQGSDKGEATTKNEKNVKNEKKYTIPTCEDVEEYFYNSGIKNEDVPLEAEKFINHYEDMDWRKNKGTGKRIDNWHRQAGTWIANYKKWNRPENGQDDKAVKNALDAVNRIDWEN